MKIIVPCKDCFDQGKQSWNNNLYEIDITEDGLYSFSCREHHANQFVLGNPKFELLFESGLNAIADHYYREATTSVYVALERFFQFALYSKLVAQGLISTYEEFEKYFKFISPQSERQVGAFYASFYPASALLNQAGYKKIVEFRNKAIHKGYIPSEAEAVAFSEDVKSIIDILWDRFAEEHNVDLAFDLYKEHLRSVHKTKRIDGQPFFLNKYSTYSLIRRKIASIQDYVQGLRAQKKIVLGLQLLDVDVEHLKKIY